MLLILMAFIDAGTFEMMSSLLIKDENIKYFYYKQNYKCTCGIYHRHIDF